MIAVEKGAEGHLDFPVKACSRFSTPNLTKISETT